MTSGALLLLRVLVSAKVLTACVSCFSDLLCVRTGALRQGDDTVERWEQKFFEVTAPSYQVGGCTQVTLCLVRVETASHVMCLEQIPQMLSLLVTLFFSVPAQVVMLDSLD